MARKNAIAIEGVKDMSAKSSAYPGQCIHEWTGAFERQTCAKGCGSTCRRGETGKIESYSAGRALITTEEPKWMQAMRARQSAPRRAGGAR